MAQTAIEHSRGEELRDRRPAPDRQGPPSTPPTSGGGGGDGGGGFFDIYKPSQGYYTRIWTGVSLGVLICWMAHFLYEKFGVVGTGTTTKYIQTGVAVATILGLGLVSYWALALNRRICDFLIATEGEMKKVNWTSRKEIIGSTKVVIFVVVAMSVLLFVVDVFFMVFFNSIGILHGGGFKELFGLN